MKIVSKSLSQHLVMLQGKLKLKKSYIFVDFYCIFQYPIVLIIS